MELPPLLMDVEAIQYMEGHPRLLTDVVAIRYLDVPPPPHSRMLRRFSISKYPPPPLLIL